ncbi:MAG: hypothetical protein P1U46_02055 [Patescibacteria group bacterium]|nr:hypothetical protein [Patescibacteria group bacterium]
MIFIVHHRLLAFFKTSSFSILSKISIVLSKNTVFHSGKTVSISATDNLNSLPN